MKVASRYGDTLGGAVIVDSPIRSPEEEARHPLERPPMGNKRVYETFDAALARFRLMPEQLCENPSRKERSLSERTEKMTDMSEECLDIINNGHFNIGDPGPLHTPIRGFALRRNDKLAVILETETDSKATSTAVEHRPGTVRLSVERAKLINIAGVEAELVGVVPYSVRTAEGDPMNRALKESAQVRSVTISPGDVATATYTIDWLENLPASPFVWPDTIKTTTNTTKTRSIGMTDGDLTISSDSEQFSLARTAAKLVISGVTF
jgi:hypothetical protein